ncbi:aldolase/citrate lyase family protein [Streptomonospora arabica]
MAPGADTGPSPSRLAGALEEMNAGLDARLARADARLRRDYPGADGGRQPVHTVYVPADRIRRGLAAAWGEQAVAALRAFAPGAAELAAATGLEEADVAAAQPRVLAKLDREPVEDLRVDAEDGYGVRTDDEEDAHVGAAAAALGADVAAGTAPPGVGIRMKGMAAEGRRRGTRSLALFLSGLLEAAGGLPEGLRITLPKITSVEQVEAAAWALARMERLFGLAEGRLRFELQVETPQCVIGPGGTADLARMVRAGGGRVTALHFGTYDYTAACGVTAAHQAMDHPAADYAKAVMQVAAAGTGVRLSDGAANVLPVGAAEQVHAAWRLHTRLVVRALERAFYQGWDMHPHQLPTRYLATYVFYRRAFGPAAARLADYLGSVGGTVLDEPATAQALAAVLTRGLQCGALDEPEVAAACGAGADDLAALAQRRVG